MINIFSLFCSVEFNSVMIYWAQLQGKYFQKHNPHVLTELTITWEQKGLISIHISLQGTLVVTSTDPQTSLLVEANSYFVGPRKLFLKLSSLWPYAKRDWHLGCGHWLPFLLQNKTMAFLCCYISSSSITMTPSSPPRYLYVIYLCQLLL
jgi:hypothetical protein